MIRSVFVAVALLGVMLGVPASAIAQDAGSAVSIQDELFSPQTGQITAGSALNWSNDGAENHTVTADDGSFDSGVLASGKTFAFTFAAPGAYAYYCLLHGGPGGQGMAGTVVVS
jgi:plastocyanin